MDTSAEEKKLIWVVFYGLSALGKTFFLNHFLKSCEEKKVNCQIVSSDDCSKKIIDDLKAKDPSLSDDAAFEKSRKGAIKLFEDSIQKEVNSLKNGCNIIVLDKVMNGGRFLKNLDKTFNPKCSTKLVALIPECPEPFNYSPHGVVPFSESLIINVIFRILNREEHQTVSGSDEKKLSLGLSFVKLYNNLKSLTEKKDEGGIDQFFEISFHQESADTKKQIPEELSNLLKETLKKLKPFDDPSPCKELAEFVRAKKTLEGVLTWGNEAQQTEQIGQIISLFDSMTN